MNEIELIDFCEEHFTDYAVCKALKCEELCKEYGKPDCAACYEVKHYNEQLYNILRERR